ncbi:MAG: HAMP domain-containing protein, partial [Xanthomonadaceae bacterium]|nr:HAMP domain-containing protein [Xanthomonadaceae bacterium]
MFRNMRIGLRLTAGFAAVLLLLIVIGLVGIQQLNRVNGETAEIFHDRWPKTVQANEIIDNLNVISRALRNALLTDDASFRQAEWQRISDARKLIGERVEQLEKTSNTATGKNLLAKVKDATDAFLAGAERAMRMAQTDRNQAAEYLLKEMRAFNQAALQSATDLILYQERAMDQASQEAAAFVRQAERLILLLSVSALAVAAAMAFWITRSITRPLTEAVAAANALAGGDLGVRLQSRSRDEVGELLQAMNVMIERLSQTI